MVLGWFRLNKLKKSDCKEKMKCICRSSFFLFRMVEVCYSNKILVKLLLLCGS